MWSCVYDAVLSSGLDYSWGSLIGDLVYFKQRLVPLTLNLYRLLFINRRFILSSIFRLRNESGELIARELRPTLPDDPLALLCAPSLALRLNGVIAKRDYFRVLDMGRFTSEKT